MNLFDAIASKARAHSGCDVIPHGISQDRMDAHVILQEISSISLTSYQHVYQVQGYWHMRASEVGDFDHIQVLLDLLSLGSAQATLTFVAHKHGFYSMRLPFSILVKNDKLLGFSIQEVHYG